MGGALGRQGNAEVLGTGRGIMRGSSIFRRLPISLSALSLAGLLAAGAQAQDGLVALTGQGAPGRGPGVVFDEFGLPSLSVWGYAGFEATLTGETVTPDTDQGIWFGYSAEDGTLYPVALEGAGAPDTPGLTVFENPRLPVVNDTSGVAFLSSLSGEGVGDENDEGIWAGIPEVLVPAGTQLVARTGDRAPGTPPTVIFEKLAEVGSAEEEGFTFNDSDEVAFIARIDGDLDVVDADTDQGIWAGAYNTLQLIARKGFPAPDIVIGGVVIESFKSIPLLNDAGQVAFAGTLDGQPSSGVDPENDEAIWVGSAGQVQLLVREGDPAPGAPGTRFEDLANEDTPPVPERRRDGGVQIRS